MTQELEILRAFLNTLSISNDTRELRDDLPGLLSSRDAWNRRFDNFPCFSYLVDSPEHLFEVRDVLRQFIERIDGASDRLSDLFAKVGLSLRVEASSSAVAAKAYIPSPIGVPGNLLCVAADLIISGEMVKLKTCPDCRCVFVDNTRNSSKRWCGMTKGGPEGRACGTIAKVRAFRTRKAASKLAG